MPTSSVDPIVAPRWESVSRAASYGQVSPGSIYKMVNDGRLTKHKLGPRSTRVDLNELDAMGSLLGAS